MKRWSLVLFRLVIALAIVFAGAGVLNPGNSAQAGISNPDGLRPGSLTAAWRWVDTLGSTGSPYPPNIQGDRLFRPAGIFIDAGGRLSLTEESGKRVWGFADVDFTNPIKTPAASGVNDPFWNPRDVTRSHDLTWVIDSHHLVVLDNAGAIVKDFYNFDVTDPALGWVNNNFQCANSLSFDDLTDLLYVAQNCGQNPVLVLHVETPDPYSPTSLTLVDAFNLGDWQKNHIQTADLNEDASSEVYVSSDNGTFQCEQPAAMPGNWNCSPYAQDSLHRTRGLTYSAGEHELYALDQVDWDWNQSGLRKCHYDGSCENIVTNNTLNNTPNLRFDDPQDLALAASGDFYITDAARSVVARLSFSGGLSYVPVFGVLDEAYVTAAGYLNNPSSVLTDADDNLYVAENSGRRVLSFDAAGAPRRESG
jgi:sugar lactone lactonase YvrE